MKPEKQCDGCQKLSAMADWELQCPSGDPECIGTTIKSPPFIGWRLLEDGEMRRIGDEVYNAPQKVWEPLTGRHEHIGELSHAQGVYRTQPCRRKEFFVSA